MKLIITLLAAALILNVQFSDISKHKSNESNRRLNLFCPDPPSFTETVKTVSDNDGTNSGTEEIDQDWYSKAMEQIEKDEYNISYSEELSTYQSPNRANNIRFIYHEDGFTAVTRDAGGETRDEWSIDFKVADVKRQTTNEKTPPSPLFQRGSRGGFCFRNVKLELMEIKQV